MGKKCQIINKCPHPLFGTSEYMRQVGGKSCIGVKQCVPRELLITPKKTLMEM